MHLRLVHYEILDANHWIINKRGNKVNYHLHKHAIILNVATINDINCERWLQITDITELTFKLVLLEQHLAG